MDDIPFMQSFLSSIIPVLITAFIAIGGGGLAMWKWLQAQERIKRLDEAERQSRDADIKQKATNSTWQRATEIMDRDRKAIDRLTQERNDCLEKLKDK